MMKRTALLMAGLLFVFGCASDDGDSIGAPTSTTAATSTTVVEADPVDATLAETVEEPTTTTTTSAPPAAFPTDACDSQPSVRIGITSETIVSGGLEYMTQWSVPSSYDGSPLPVVLDFHGIGSNGSQQSLFSGIGPLAEREGFVAVHPTGLSTPTDDRASWELPQFDSDDRDDVQFVRDLLDTLTSNVCIDQERVYAAGMSNGGFFTSVMVCELSERIAAAVSVAGVTHDDSCEPAEPVPYLAFHGVDDSVVPFDGSGVSTLPGAEVAGAFFEQVPKEEFAEFAADFGCGTSADTAVSDLVTRTTFGGCADDVEVAFYTITDGGHTWPGSVVSQSIAALGVTNTDIDATQLAWDFFVRSTPAAD
ncbi:MAG: prolyl oligopeptidase family serine peptidase [Acidimicrobiales bacterium]|nr:prolyl oligopeptidase family serine peptidase [Acidimicrobiales bacterium]